LRYCPARVARVSPKTKCCQSSPRCARCPARLLCAATCPNNEADTNTLVAEIFARHPQRDLPLPVRKQLAGLAAMRL
jgi:hypothetical protein